MAKMWTLLWTIDTCFFSDWTSIDIEGGDEFSHEKHEFSPEIQEKLDS